MPRNKTTHRSAENYGLNCEVVLLVMWGSITLKIEFRYYREDTYILRCSSFGRGGGGGGGHHKVRFHWICFIYVK